MKLFFSITVVLAIFSFSLFAFSGRNKVESAKLESVTVVGQIGVYGNEPHTWLGFVDNKGVEYGLEASGKDLKELRNLQGILLELSGLLEPVPEGQPVGYQTLSGGKIHVEKYHPYKD